MAGEACPRAPTPAPPLRSRPPARHGCRGYAPRPDRRPWRPGRPYQSQQLGVFGVQRVGRGGPVLRRLQRPQDQRTYRLAYGRGEGGGQLVAGAARDGDMEPGVQVVEVGGAHSGLPHALQERLRLVEVLRRGVLRGGLEAGALQDHPGLQHIVQSVAAEGEVQAQQPAQRIVRVPYDPGPGVRPAPGLGGQYPDRLQHPQRLAQCGAADTEDRCQLALGRQAVPGLEFSGEHPLLDALQYELMCARLPHRSPFGGHPQLPGSALMLPCKNYVTQGVWSDQYRPRVRRGPTAGAEGQVTARVRPRLPVRPPGPDAVPRAGTARGGAAAPGWWSRSVRAPAGAARPVG